MIGSIIWLFRGRAAEFWDLTKVNVSWHLWRHSECTRTMPDALEMQKTKKTKSSVLLPLLDCGVIVGESKQIKLRSSAEKRALVSGRRFQWGCHPPLLGKLPECIHLVNLPSQLCVSAAQSVQGRRGCSTEHRVFVHSAWLTRPLSAWMTAQVRVCDAASTAALTGRQPHGAMH